MSVGLGLRGKVPPAGAGTVARLLTDIAPARGGQDKITVAVVCVRPPRRSLP